VSEVAAHAKVNLRHRVLARDETGYHAVETILARTGLADTVSLEDADTGVALTVEGGTGDDVPTDDRNLCVRAATRFLAAAFRDGEAPGVRIGLVKRIPAGAGLGGGSADAAATLRLLARRWPRLDERTLLSLAGELGTDVAFSLLDVPLALGWERGRRLVPLRPPRPRPALLVCPPFRVSTPEAYEWLDRERAETGLEDPGGASALPGPTRWTQWTVVERLVRNDLEPPVLRRHPELSACLETFSGRASAATMTGSGSALVGWFATEGARDEARAAIAATGAMETSGWRVIDTRLPV